MTTADLIAQLPGETRMAIVVGQGDFTVDELRTAFASAGPAMLTTEQASERFGFGVEYWRDVAKDMDGAVKGRHWLLPMGGCEAHMEARAIRRRRAQATPTSPTPARPQGLQAR